jgi:high-affinity nickel-transport protein
MQPLPLESAALLAAVLLLGAQHGLDPDHLAAVDGLTRSNSGGRPRLARWLGLLFALGHGLVVTVVAALLAAGTRVVHVPRWLEDTGAWISIAILLALGSINLAAALRPPAGRRPPAPALRGRVAGRLLRARHPLLVMGVGALFALSFDTVSQAAMLSLSARAASGWPLAIAAGAVFSAGMMASDAVNSLWISRLLARADARSHLASRVMSLAVAFASLATATFGAARYFSTAVAAFADGRELAFGLTLTAALAASYVVALAVSRVRG